MLKLEQARSDEQKAEQKVAKAQARLEACRTHVRNLEASLAHARSSQQLSHLDVPDGGSGQQQSQPDLNGHAPDNAQEDNAQTPSDSGSQTPPADQVTSLPPAEGRADIGQNQEQDPTGATETTGASATPVDPMTPLPPVEGRVDVGQNQEQEPSGDEEQSEESNEEAQEADTHQ